MRPSRVATAATTGQSLPRTARADRTADDQAPELLIEEWVNADLEGADVLIVASRLSDADGMNDRARRVLQGEGYLGADQIRVGSGAFSEGDQVLALRNDYGLGLHGARGTIDHIDLGPEHLVITAEGNDQNTVPFEYLAGGYPTHWYGTTIHKTQIHMVHQLDNLAHRSLARGLERDHRLELGL